MYFYFLGSPTGDSQNGSSGVNFTEHGFLSDRGCSQPIFHRWSKQESSERGSGDRCSLKIQWSKERKKEKNSSSRQWSAFISSCSVLDVIKSDQFVTGAFSTSLFLFLWAADAGLLIFIFIFSIHYQSHICLTSAIWSVSFFSFNCLSKPLTLLWAKH